MQSAEAKSEKPSQVHESAYLRIRKHVNFTQTCTGADMEMVTSGGEVAFVTRMIKESMQLRNQVQWYTSMLGKLSSISVLVETLMKNNNHNYAVTELVQGKTKRWALAWSWGERRPKMVRYLPLPFSALY